MGKGYCAWCGSELPEGFEFCPKCGESAVTKTSQKEKYTPCKEPPPSACSKGSKSRKRKKVAICASIAAAVFALALGALVARAGYTHEPGDEVKLGKTIVRLSSNYSVVEQSSVEETLHSDVFAESSKYVHIYINVDNKAGKDAAYINVTARGPSGDPIGVADDLTFSIYGGSVGESDSEHVDKKSSERTSWWLRYDGDGTYKISVDVAYRQSATYHLNVNS